MICPDKFTPFDKSVVGKMRHLMQDAGSDISLNQLKFSKLRFFEDISEFILALDVLFMLGKIEFDIEGEVIHYVD